MYTKLVVSQTPHENWKGIRSDCASVMLIASKKPIILARHWLARICNHTDKAVCKWKANSTVIDNIIETRLSWNQFVSMHIYLPHIVSYLWIVVRFRFFVDVSTQNGLAKRNLVCQKITYLKSSVFGGQLKARALVNLLGRASELKCLETIKYLR